MRVVTRITARAIRHDTASLSDVAVRDELSTVRIQGDYRSVRASRTDALRCQRDLHVQYMLLSTLCFYGIDAIYNDLVRSIL